MTKKKGTENYAENLTRCMFRVLTRCCALILTGLAADCAAPPPLRESKASNTPRKSGNNHVCSRKKRIHIGVVKSEKKTKNSAPKSILTQIMICCVAFKEHTLEESTEGMHLSLRER